MKPIKHTNFNSRKTTHKIPDILHIREEKKEKKKKIRNKNNDTNQN
jgi:hypothetical protein